MVEDRQRRPLHRLTAGLLVATVHNKAKLPLFRLRAGSGRAALERRIALADIDGLYRSYLLGAILPMILGSR